MTRFERSVEKVRGVMLAVRLAELLDWYQKFAPLVVHVAMPERLRVLLQERPDVAESIGFIPRGADGAFEFRGFYLYRIKS